MIVLLDVRFLNIFQCSHVHAATDVAMEDQKDTLQDHQDPADNNNGDNDPFPMSNITIILILPTAHLDDHPDPLYHNIDKIQYTKTE